MASESAFAEHESGDQLLMLVAEDDESGSVQRRIYLKDDVHSAASTDVHA